ncbi:MAG: site-specific integrase [Alphaproteobacteria bacterium]
MPSLPTGQSVTPAADLRGALKTAPKTHFAHLSHNELPEFIEKLESYDGSLQTRLAIKLLLLTFVRTGELRGARWAEIDLARKEWRIPAERMKMRSPHIVPLSKQAIMVLETLQKLNGHREFVFPSPQSPRQCISNNTMLYALYTMGFKNKTTIHGLRATASTILNEHGFPRDVIERQLAHQERNRVRAAYDHSEHLPARREMMQWWGHFIAGKTTTKHNIISMKRAAR